MTAWQQRVRHYARRQLVWFRQTPDIQWVDLVEDEPPWESAERLLATMRAHRVATAEVVQ